MLFVFVLFFFKQKTAYEMRISDWSSDVFSSDLLRRVNHEIGDGHHAGTDEGGRAREQAEQDKAAADELDGAGGAGHREDFRLGEIARREAQPLHRAVGHEGGAGGHTQDRQSTRLNSSPQSAARMPYYA